MFDITWLLAILSLSGNIFNIKKKVTCFYIWTIGEIFWLALDLTNAVYGRSFLDLIQFIMAVWGIVEWKRGETKNEKI